MRFPVEMVQGKANGKGEMAVATEVVMPKWGLTMKEGKISRWFASEGDAVVKGEPLFEVETNKITNAVESPAGGVLFQIVVAAGETVPIKTVVAVLAEPGEQPQRREAVVIKAAGAAGRGAEPVGGPEKPAADFVKASPIARRLAKEWDIDLAQVAASGPDGRVTEGDVRQFKESGAPGPAISPQAKALAAEAGIDLALIAGTGKDGRITKADVLRAMQPVPSAAPREAAQQTPTAPVGPGLIPFAGMRKIIADNMLASLQQSAQLSVFVEIDATPLTSFRDRVRKKSSGQGPEKVSYTDIIAMAVCRSLREFPILNSWLTEEGIMVHEGVNLGVAVALPEGLIVPNVKNAHQKGLLQLAAEIRQLAGRAREGQLTLDDIQGGTFTITNVSMLGVDGFTPILNPPETAILGVGRAVEKPAVYRGNICIRTLMTLSLTFDHRVTDGAPAMRFLRALADYLEEPALIVT